MSSKELIYNDLPGPVWEYLRREILLFFFPKTSLHAREEVGKWTSSPQAGVSLVLHWLAPQLNCLARHRHLTHLIRNKDGRSNLYILNSHRVCLDLLSQQCVFLPPQQQGKVKPENIPHVMLPDSPTWRRVMTSQEVYSRYIYMRWIIHQFLINLVK